jgi:hypothetical protein
LTFLKRFARTEQFGQDLRSRIRVSCGRTEFLKEFPSYVHVERKLLSQRRKLSLGGRVRLARILGSRSQLLSATSEFLPYLAIFLMCGPQILGAPPQLLNKLAIFFLCLASDLADIPPVLGRTALDLSDATLLLRRYSPLFGVGAPCFFLSLEGRL